MTDGSQCPPCDITAVPQARRSRPSFTPAGRALLTCRAGTRYTPSDRHLCHHGGEDKDAVLLRLTSDGHALSSKRGSLWDKAAVLARSLSPKDPLGVQRNDSDPLSLTMPGAQAGGGSAAKSFQPSPTGGQQAPAAPTTQGTASSLGLCRVSFGSQQQGEWSVPAEPPAVPHGHRWTQAHRPRFRGRG